MVRQLRGSNPALVSSGLVTAPSLQRRTAKLAPGIVPHGYSHYQDSHHHHGGKPGISVGISLFPGLGYSYGSIRGYNYGYYGAYNYGLNGAYCPLPASLYSEGYTASYPAPQYVPSVNFDPGSLPSEMSYEVDPTSQLSTDEVKFRSNSTELADDESLNYLLSLAAALLSPELIDQKFVVEGHASAEGSSGSNRILSQQRANAVFDFLVAQGVNPDRLLSVGYGEDMARFPASAPAHLRAEDRRVVVYRIVE